DLHAELAAEGLADVRGSSSRGLVAGNDVGTHRRALGALGVARPGDHHLDGLLLGLSPGVPLHRKKRDGDANNSMAHGQRTTRRGPMTSSGPRSMKMRALQRPQRSSMPPGTRRAMSRPQSQRSSSGEQE